MTLAWHDRSQYGIALRDLIKDLQRTYQHTKDSKLKLKLSHSIAYIIQTQASLIRDEKNVEQRLKRLEELQGIKK